MFSLLFPFLFVCARKRTHTPYYFVSISDLVSDTWQSLMVSSASQPASLSVKVVLGTIWATLLERPEVQVQVLVDDLSSGPSSVQAQLTTNTSGAQPRPIWTRPTVEMAPPNRDTSPPTLLDQLHKELPRCFQQSMNLGCGSKANMSRVPRVPTSPNRPPAPCPHLQVYLRCLVCSSQVSLHPSALVWLWTCL